MCQRARLTRLDNPVRSYKCRTMFEAVPLEIPMQAAISSLVSPSAKRSSAVNCRFVRASMDLCTSISGRRNSAAEPEIGRSRELSVCRLSSRHSLDRWLRRLAKVHRGRLGEVVSCKPGLRYREQLLADRFRWAGRVAASESGAGARNPSGRGGSPGRLRISLDYRPCQNFNW